MIIESSPVKRRGPCIAMTRFSLPYPWTIAMEPDSTMKKFAPIYKFLRSQG